ncbi:general odorant-binding protein 72-like [Periplaneta americana]|uniref:general odorant-binding protein 72-like n=1 Tax=Periplaneta americana TaxID=6978 RepID=UPI0037E95E5F
MQRLFPALLCVVLLSCSVNGLTIEQIKQALKMMRNSCVPKSGADMELVEGIQEGKFPEDKNLKCYMKCVMGMMQTMKSGRYKPDAAIAQVRIMMPESIKERAVTVLDGCRKAAQGVKDACEVAFLTTKCIYESDPEIFLFP